MIPNDFAYYRPTAAAEAYDLFQKSLAEKKETHYYGGGTEIISMARLYTLHPDTVIDLKGIPECRVFERRGGEWVFGAALTLSEITEANPWQLLSETAGRVADHTTRVKITLGGNIAAEIPYREVVLPFLLADADALIGTKNRFRKAPLTEVFDECLRLETGEFLAQLIVDEKYLTMPWVHVKRTRLDWIDYPLFTVAALEVRGFIRIAFSGLCTFPFRTAAVEEALNEPGAPMDKRIDNVVASLPAPILSDILGSAGYREFVLRNTLRDTLMRLEGRRHA